MKYLLAFALIAAVASQSLIKPKDLHGLSESQIAEVLEILEAIHSPSTDPTTAAMLEQMLLELLGVGPPSPIIIPGIVDDENKPVHLPGIVDEYQPIDLSPILVDFPVHESAIAPTPVAPSSSPLVQIIVNVNQPADQPGPGIDRPFPIETEEEEVIPTPVDFVEDSDQVIVVEQPEIEAEPVNIAPIIVAPAVIAPETLN